MPGGTSTERFSIAILAGGQSRRMGRDKALLPWGERLMIDQMISIARGVPESAETLIIGDKPAYHGRGARVIADRFPGAGPLGGIATALAVAGTDRVFVLAIDMPLASPALISAIGSHQADADAVVPEAPDPSTGAIRLQVLHAIYHRRCLEPAQKCLCQNERRVQALLDVVTVERVGTEWLRAWDPELRSFENLNDPDEYARARHSRRRLKEVGVSVSGKRDYRKFLNADGQLHVRYLPRRAYTELVSEYRRDDAIIDEVFEELYFSWDLNQKLEEMEASGEEPSKAVAAQRVIDELEDRDWWLVMGAFERAFARDFAANAERWAAVLDSIYDDQESNGWRDVQP